MPFSTCRTCPAWGGSSAGTVAAKGSAQPAPPPLWRQRPQRKCDPSPRQRRLQRLQAQAQPSTGASSATGGAPSASSQADMASMAEQQQQQAQVAVITTQGCPYCKKAKAALVGAGIAFNEYDLGEQIEALTRVKAATGQSTVPQIFVGGRLLGGASDVILLIERGELQQLVAAAAAPPLPTELQAVVQQAGAAAAAAAAAAKAASAEAAGSPEQEQLRELAAGLRAAKGGSPGATFTLQAATQWLQAAQGLAPEAAAAALGRLQAAQLLTIADAGLSSEMPLGPELLQTRPQLQVQLVADAQEPTNWSEPLNGQFAWFGPARPTAQVAEAVRSRILRLYDRHLTGDGKKVNYAALRGDPEWADFVAATAELQKVDLAQLSSREERMAFFINIYNALVVHALVVFGPADGTLSRLRWFDSISYLIGGRRWSSNDVEHGVLRGNAPSPASLFSLLGKPQWAGKTFKAGDPRAALAIQPVDPRIHFALNCGAASCPPIRVYTPDRLEFGLEAAASAFCAGEVAVDKAAGELELSMILKWYGPDFGSKQQLMDFLVAHLPAGPAGDLQELLASRGAEGIKLRFRPYDWTTNAAV